MDGTEFCGVPYTIWSIGANDCKWNKTVIYWTIANNLPGLSMAALKSAYTEAWAYWEEVCNIHAIWVDSPTQADVIISAGFIDGPQGTLAWSEMPCGMNDQPLQQLYDSAERLWVNSANPGRNAIDLVRVAAHEIGHAIGIPHLPAGTNNLMAPMYSLAIRKPQIGDIEQAQDRYGLPLPKPPVPDSPWIIFFKALLDWLLKRLNIRS